MRPKRSARDEYDAAMLDELANQPGELATFARVFAGMAAEIRAKQHRRQEMQAAAEIQQSILPAPLTREGRPGRSTCMPKCIRRARSAAIFTTIF